MGLLDFISPGQKNRDNQMNSTQTHIRIAEIRENVVVLKNGGMRAVLKTSSINFNLKSEEEQNAIVYSYQSFLNSLEFPIQILVRSKKLDIDDYIDGVKKLGEKQQNKLLQEQTMEYAQYIKRLVEYADIMEKEFYVVVPFDPGRIQSGESTKKFYSFFQRLAPKDSYADIKLRRSEFNNLKKGLLQRVNVIQAGLENCGLKVEQMDTTSLIELYYESYNPMTSRSQKLKDLMNTAITTDEQAVEAAKEKVSVPQATKET
jgi:type IV secretory pathway VirB4 component